MLLEGTLVRTALSSMLAVHERIVLLSVLVGMGKSNLNVLTLQMDDGIEGIRSHAVFQQVLQAVARKDPTAIVHDGQPGIEIGIVAEHVLHDFIMEFIVQEQRGIRLKKDVGTGFFSRILRSVTLYLTALEGGYAHLPGAVGVHLEMGTQSVHSLHAHPIQPYRLLEGF